MRNGKERKSNIFASTQSINLRQFTSINSNNRKQNKNHTIQNVHCWFVLHKTLYIKLLVPNIMFLVLVFLLFCMVLPEMLKIRMPKWCAIFLMLNNLDERYATFVCMPYTIKVWWVSVVGRSQQATLRRKNVEFSHTFLEWNFWKRKENGKEFWISFDHIAWSLRI